MKALLPALLLALPAFADPLDDRASAVFSASYAEACMGAFLEDGSLIEVPERVSMLSAVTWGGAPVPVEIWRFRCNIGAYNTQSVLIAHSDSNGIMPLMLARPDIDIIHEIPGDFDSPVKEVRIVGWSSSPFVVNADLDADQAELREHAFWRGLGDASSTTVWRLVDEAFRLQRHDVDATYDGEINPETLVQFD
jgi:hypothetical protein